MLYRITTNLSIDLIRKPGRQLVDIDESRFETDEGTEAEFPLLSRVDGSDPADVVRRREIAARLQVALDALPPYHRGVIVMREIEGLSYEEMAQAMGVSKGTIMSRLFHARQKLQKALADCYVEQIGTRPGFGSRRQDSRRSGRQGGGRVMSLSSDNMMKLMAYADGELEGAERTEAEMLLASSVEAVAFIEQIAGLGELVEQGHEDRLGKTIKAFDVADAVMAAVKNSEPASKRQVVHGRS